MSKPVLFWMFFFMSFCGVAAAQNSGYIFIQTQPKQAFTIEMNGKKYPSNAKAEVWLTALKPGTYTLFSTISGVPGVQKFAIPIQAKPVGLQLKKEANNTWKLYAVAAPALVRSEVVKVPAVPTTPQEASSDFADMLSDVVGKEAIAKPAITVAPKPATPAVVAAAPAVSAKVSEAADTLQPNSVEAVADTAEANTQGVVLANDVYKGTERMLTFVAFTGNNKDTVAVSLTPLPMQDSVPVKQVPPVSFIETPTLTASTVATQTPLLDTLEKPKATIDTVKVDATNATNNTGVSNPFYTATTPTKAETPVTIQRINNCTEKATEADFLRLRKRIVANGIDKEMTEIARKQMVLKCFTSAQVGMLGNMYLSDEGRYQFFAMAIAYVQDVESFPLLKSQLIEDAFKVKFEALLRGK